MSAQTYSGGYHPGQEHSLMHCPHEDAVPHGQDKAPLSGSCLPTGPATNLFRGMVAQNVLA